MLRFRRCESSGLAGQLEMWIAMNQGRVQGCFAVSRERLPPRRHIGFPVVVHAEVDRGRLFWSGLCRPPLSPCSGHFQEP